MAIRKHCPLILLAFSILSTTFPTLAQQPHYWSVALANTLMQRNTGAPGQSLTPWSYWKGYTLNGFEMLWLSTGDGRYLNYIKQQMDPFIDRDGNLVGVTLDSLDNAMAGNIVVGLYEHTRDPRYRVAATRIRRMFDKYPRNADGGFWHNPRLPGEMWVDGVFMGEMFLLRYGDVIGDRKYCFDEAEKQITVFAHHALKDKSGLYYHAWAANPDLATVVPQRKVHWADPATGLSPEVWSEGLGWYALVVVEALARLPADYPRRSEVLHIYQQLAAGLKQAQDPETGGWFFVVDKPDRKDNWIDTSGSAMFTYALERGIELGLLVRKEYAPVVAAGYRAITHNASVNGDGLVDISSACDGVCVQASYADYVGCKRVLNAKEAVAGFLWATTAVEKPGRVNQLGTVSIRAQVSRPGRNRGMSNQTQRELRSAGQGMGEITHTVRPGRGTASILQTVTFLALVQAGLIAQAESSPSQFPPYLADNFDYVSFTRFDAPAPPKSLIYQSNGFMALQESGFGGQKIIIPVAGPAAPVNEGERLVALEIDSPVFVDESRTTFGLSDPSARHSLTYLADRTIYRAAFDNGLKVSIVVYPVYGKAAAVVRTVVEHAPQPVTAILQVRGLGFQVLPGSDSRLLGFGSSKWPYRLLLAGEPQNPVQGGRFEWKLASGTSAALIIALGGDEPQANAVLAELRSSTDLFDAETHRLWNEYLGSAPLVAPAQPIQFTIGTSNQKESIAPEELVRSELWFWRGLLNTTCQARYLPACPMVIADWNVFMGMWSNDGIAETLALMGTNRTDIARDSLLAWFRYAVNAKGDGTLPWTIFPSGKNTFQALGPERDTQGIPVQATLVGEYVRLTGDKSILGEKPGGFAGDRTVWESLLGYQRNLLKVRDTNHDHLIDWLNTYETGWDDKDSPFVDLKGHPTSSINEQVFNLWNLQEIVYLSKIQGEDPAPWQNEFSIAQQAIRNKLWDPASERYWDLDVETGKLWKQGENLDAYYLLYFETDRARIDAMMKRLNDPAKFNGALLPTLAFDTPHWGGYWRGPAWPRIFGYIGMALARSGHVSEGFDWLSRAISSNLGPLLPENVDPKAYPPGEHAIGSVRIMGYDALDTLLLPDVAGLRTWGGEDLAVAPAAALGKLFVRNQKWMGDRYDAVFDPGQPTLLWRNGEALDPLPADRIWHAHKKGSKVTFEAE